MPKRQPTPLSILKAAERFANGRAVKGSLVWEHIYDAYVYGARRALGI